HGMTHGTIAGMLLTDLILGRDNPWSTLYDPSRRTLRAAGAFLRENLNTAIQYLDWLTPGDSPPAVDLAPNEGTGLRQGLRNVAVYGDRDGRLHGLSAFCPHLGGVVHWNNVEKTWDCPCHGSRFAADGKVIHGPSLAALKPAEED